MTRWSCERGPPSRRNTATGGTRARKGGSGEETPHLPLLPPHIFCQDLPSAKPIWKPDGKGAQVRQSTGHILPGGEAENGEGMG